MANVYTQILERIFSSRHKPDDITVAFERNEIAKTAKELGLPEPKNLGDLLYSFRYRLALPDSVRKTAPAGREWIIRSVGRSKYQFALVREWSVVPRENWRAVKVPDSTPGVILKYALSDEQAVLARLRYNRLIDIFLGVVCYSLQNHLRTFVKGIGQAETDEIYVGIDRYGAHYVVPVQAKAGNDRISVVQIEQDVALCAEKFPGLVCRAIAAQFMMDNVIALFEFAVGAEGIETISERHYKLVPAEQVTDDDLKLYRLPQAEAPP